MLYDRCGILPPGVLLLRTLRLARALAIRRHDASERRKHESCIRLHRRPVLVQQANSSHGVAAGLRLWRHTRARACNQGM